MAWAPFWEGRYLFVTEIDTVLEVAGIFAAGNFALRNLLFADDRKRTQGEIKQVSLLLLLPTYIRCKYYDEPLTCCWVNSLCW